MNPMWTEEENACQDNCLYAAPLSRVNYGSHGGIWCASFGSYVTLGRECEVYKKSRSFQ